MAFLFKIIKSELIRGSFVLLIFFNSFNFLNYLFQFLMARMLEVSDYGVLAALMGIIYIFTIPNEAIQLIASRYATEFCEENKIRKIKTLIKYLSKSFFKVALILFLIFIPLSFLTSYFLRIKLSLILLTNCLIFFVFVLPINRGILQGLKSFKKLGILMVIESLIKIIFAVFLVYLGLRVYGAIFGILAGAFFSLCLSFVFLKEIFKTKEKEGEKVGPIKSYSLNTFLLIAMVWIVLSLDVIIVKHFFSDEIAGIYAVASLLGKAIFFATNPIAKAMFPIVSEKKANKKDALLKAVFLIFLISIPAILLFVFTPKLIILILFGKKYFSGYNLLIFTGISYTFLSISNLLLYFLLSLKRKLKLIFIFPIIEVFLLILFSSTIFNYVFGLLISQAIFLVYLCFAFKNEKDKYNYSST